MRLLVFALFGCVFCDPSPRFRNELNNKLVNNKENIESPIVVKKDRDKRNANPPDIEPPVEQPIDKSMAELSRNPEFLRNLKIVFGLEKQPVAPASFVFDEDTINLSNENNSGMDDRLRPHRTVLQKFHGFVETTTQKPIVTGNDIQTDRKDDQGTYIENQIQQVFGTPPHFDRETPSVMATPTNNKTNNSVTSPQMINETNTGDVENGTDYRFTSAYIIKESYNRLGNGGSSTNIRLCYKYLLLLAFIVVFLL